MKCDELNEGLIGTLGFALVVLIVLGFFFGGICGIYGCSRHFDKHVVKIEFTDGTVRKFLTHCSYIRGWNLEIKNDEEIRFFQPYDTWSFPIDKIKNWERKYEK